MTTQAAYNEDFYAHQMDASRTSARVVLRTLFELYRPESVIDVGCGTGSWLAECQAAGVDDVIGFDGAHVMPHLLQIPRERFLPTDLSHSFEGKLPRRFDLAISVEVAEHISQSGAEQFIRSLTSYADVVLFSAAMPYQGGTHHVNENWVEYWALQFQKLGYSAVDCIRDKVWHDPKVEWWYRQNVIVFVKDTVRGELFPGFPFAPPRSLVHPEMFLHAIQRGKREDLAFRDVDYHRRLGEAVSSGRVLREEELVAYSLLHEVSFEKAREVEPPPPIDRPRAIRRDDLGQARWEYGRAVLGPILHHFCDRLRLYFAAYPADDSVVLYVARGGLRLGYLYRRFLEQNGLEEPIEQKAFGTSRLATAKGCLTRDFELAGRVITREFAGQTMRSMLAAVMPEVALDLPDATATLPVTLEHFQAIFSSQTTWGAAVREYFERQARHLDAYIEGLSGGRKNLLLVDTGWAGNTQAMLMRVYPQFNWFGLYFARWDYRGENPPHFSHVVGVSVEGTRYEKARPATAIFYYHHIIEDPLEPACASVECYVADPLTGEARPNVEASAESVAPGDEDDLFAGIVAYFDQTSQKDHIAIANRAREAYERLAADILHPSRRTAEILEVRHRSADFGKSEHNPVLLHGGSASLRARMHRVRTALWKQGQLALEFPRLSPAATRLFNRVKDAKP
ncbi:MAG: methyltransferase domain-containing protein [Deltaproteobacteria bacterium]|nr:methyltransferase domain-containing protein [Deltaproteobacteria bacterium]